MKTTKAVVKGLSMCIAKLVVIDYLFFIMIGFLSLHFKRADRPASNKSARRCFIFPDQQIDATHTHTATQT